MSTTVTYKGSTLTTVENATKKLTTAGTWLEDDITIQDTSSGGGGSVVVVDTPDSHGGTIREITATNTVMLQGQKQVTITTSQQTITPDTGYDGFESVVVPGAYTLEDFGTTNYVSGAVVYTGTKLRTCQFMQTGITSFIGDDVNGFANDAVGSERAVFRQCTSLQSISLQKYNVTQNAQSMFSGCTSLTSINLPNLTSLQNNTFLNTTSLRTAKFEKVAYISAYVFKGSGIQALDLLVYCNIAGGQVFNSASNFNTLILRGSTVSPCGAVNNFERTPFASSGTGGILYVPNDLISSYESATNWSTILGYTNNQIKSIESTHTDPNAPIDLTLYYADGTPIPTT